MVNNHSYGATRHAYPEGIKIKISYIVFLKWKVCDGVHLGITLYIWLNLLCLNMHFSEELKAKHLIYNNVNNN